MITPSRLSTNSTATRPSRAVDVTPEAGDASLLFFRPDSALRRNGSLFKCRTMRDRGLICVYLIRRSGSSRRALAHANLSKRDRGYYIAFIFEVESPLHKVARKRGSSAAKCKFERLSSKEYFVARRAVTVAQSLTISRTKSASSDGARRAALYTRLMGHAR